jgi:hypothetical protein
MPLLTKRKITKIMNFIDNTLLPIFCLVAVIGTIYMGIQMIIAMCSDDGEIARLQRQESLRNFPIVERDFYVE